MLVQIEKLTPTAKLIIYLLKEQQLIHGRQGLTIDDIVSMLGISERAARGALSVLKCCGLVESFIDPSSGRKRLYKLILSEVEEVSKLKPGVYLIPSSLGYRGLSLSALRVVRCSDLLLYSRWVDLRIVETARCLCKRVEVKPGEISYADVGDKVIAVVYNELLDSVRINSAVVIPTATAYSLALQMRELDSRLVFNYRTLNGDLVVRIGRDVEPRARPLRVLTLTGDEFREELCDGVRVILEVC